MAPPIPPTTPERGQSSKMTTSPPTGELPQLVVRKQRKQRTFHLGRASIAYDPMNVEDPVNPAVRQRIASLGESLQHFLEEDRKRKRDFSDSSVESITENYIKRNQNEMSPDEFDKLFMEKIQRRLDARKRLSTTWNAETASWTFW